MSSVWAGLLCAVDRAMLFGGFRLIVGWASAAVHGRIAIDQLEKWLAAIRGSAMQDTEVTGLTNGGTGGPIATGGEEPKAA